MRKCAICCGVELPIIISEMFGVAGYSDTTTPPPPQLMKWWMKAWCHALVRRFVFAGWEVIFSIFKDIGGWQPCITVYSDFFTSQQNGYTKFFLRCNTNVKICQVGREAEIYLTSTYEDNFTIILCTSNTLSFTHVIQGGDCVQFE